MISSLLIARHDSMANSALNAIETIKTPRRPNESPRPPQMYPPIIIPEIKQSTFNYDQQNITYKAHFDPT